MAFSARDTETVVIANGASLSGASGIGPALPFSIRHAGMRRAGRLTAEALDFERAASTAERLLSHRQAEPSSDGERLLETSGRRY